MIDKRQERIAAAAAHIGKDDATEVYLIQSGLRDVCAELMADFSIEVEQKQWVAWQPIDTAPKDGRAVLLLSMPYEDDQGPNGVFQRPAKAAIGRWNPEGDSWVSTGLIAGEEGYELQVTGIWMSGGGWFQPDEVSHWMPIPPAPKEEATDDER